jgi:hypothetical protein
VAERSFYGFDLFPCFLLNSEFGILNSAFCFFRPPSAEMEIFCAEKNISIKMSKKCETKPIFEKLKIAVTLGKHNFKSLRGKNVEV